MMCFVFVEKKRPMNFECIANELLLDIFEYLPSIQLLRAFYNLNDRLTQLLFIHFQRYSLDFRAISQHDFNLISREYLPKITERIQSFILSNNDDTPQQIDRFFAYNRSLNQFHALQSLVVYDLCSNELMLKLVFQLTSLPNLIRLTLAGCYLGLNEIDTQQLIDTIWSLPKLIYCYLNIHFRDGLNLFIPRVMSMSLKYLFIWGSERQQNEINALFRQTPALEQFAILLKNDDQIVDEQPRMRSIRKLKICLFSIDEYQLMQFFEAMPNLSDLTVDLNGILNGYQWENIIRHCFPTLKFFRLRMNSQLNEQIIDLLQSFETPFWLDEHHWYIRCHWNDSNSIYLYTLPYSFHDFQFDSSMQIKSNCPDERKYLYYHQVDELHWKNAAEEISPIRFPNVNHLSIVYPINENIWSMIPNFDRITSLDLSINDDDDHTQFQLLLDRIPRLDSLALNSSRISIVTSAIRNMPIRRLDFRGSEEYLHDEQIRSLFGLQCEILFIKLKNRHILIELLNHLIHLRTLNIQCEDDQTNDDEFIEWLENHLPSTCMISRDIVFHSDIRIWIR